jgi:hypothetical protein
LRRPGTGRTRIPLYLHHQHALGHAAPPGSDPVRECQTGTRGGSLGLHHRMGSQRHQSVRLRHLHSHSSVGRV